MSKRVANRNGPTRNRGPSNFKRKQAWRKAMGEHQRKLDAQHKQDHMEHAHALPNNSVTPPPNKYFPTFAKAWNRVKQFTG